MRDVFILGVGQTPVTRGGEKSVGELAAAAAAKACDPLGGRRPTALFVGNMLAGSLDSQRHLGVVVAQAAGLTGIEATVVESACSSGAAAMRCAAMAVASGEHELVLACGVERMTHAPKHDVTTGLATASDWSKEGGRGETFISLNAQLTRLYLERYRLDESALAPFSLVAHENALGNENALLRKKITADDYASSRTIEAPLRLFDVSPICDGAAAVVLGSREALEANGTRVKLLASNVSTDALALRDRSDLLELAAARASSAAVFRRAGASVKDVDFFEVHDAYAIMAALSLEAAGFCAPGEAHLLGRDRRVALDGDIPIATMGGLKARGHPVGATGVYQLVEATNQLLGRAGANQLKGASLAMTQSFGGTAATVITHLIERVS